MGKEAITLVQPRHNGAPEEGLGHVYMPGSVLMVAARIMEAGGEVTDIQDLNLRPLKNTNRTSVVGVNIIGAPYIPEVARQVGTKLPPSTRLVVGGQVVSGLSRRQRERLFGRQAIDGNDDKVLASALGIKELPSIYSTSVIPAYELLSDEDMHAYLSTEFSFYLGQGCKWHCPFCAVKDRTKKTQTAGKMVAAHEIYRRMDIVEKDLTYLVGRAKRLGLSKLDIYLSNLDVFQTPQKLSEFADLVLKLKKTHPGFVLNMRGLATADAFLAAHRKNPTAIRKMREAGFHTIGFGVDGGTPELFKKLKPQNLNRGEEGNDMLKCVNAIRVAREEYGLTPEVLMVFGHPKETEESLKAAVDFTKAMVEQYGAVPRPYVSKDIVPGNDYWIAPENKKRIEFLLKHPEYFQALDFAALPSSISHPDRTLRDLTDRYYREITDIPGNTTDVIYPVCPERDRETALALNIGKYDN